MLRLLFRTVRFGRHGLSPFWLMGLLMLVPALLYVTPQLTGFRTDAYGPFTPRIIDGDTLADGDTRFRISGVDTCEKGQPITFPDHAEPLDCGAYAASTVSRFIADHQVICFDMGGRTYGRIVARCFVYDGFRPSLDTDIGAFALRSGWAVPTSHPDITYGLAYQFISLKARFNQIGAWKGEFELPADWRHRSNFR